MRADRIRDLAGGRPEYEDLLKRPGVLGWMSDVTDDDIDAVVDRLCAVGVHSLPWFRFRAFLNDPKDDIYIECALSAGATCIVSDDRHFRLPAVAGFGIVVRTRERVRGRSQAGKDTVVSEVLVRIPDE